MRLKSLTFLSCFIFLLFIPNTVFAATDYLGPDGQVSTADSTQSFPVSIGQVTLGNPGQQTWYIVDQDTYGSENTIYKINGEVNLIIVNEAQNIQDSISVTNISGQFQVPYNSELSFYRGSDTSVNSYIYLTSASTVITGLDQKMGTVNFISASVTLISQGLENVIGPSNGQTDGILNFLGGKVMVYNTSLNPDNILVGSSEASSTCEINLNENANLNIFGLIGGGLVPGVGNSYNVSIKGNSNLTSSGVGNKYNNPTSNPDGSNINGIISISNPGNVKTSVFGNVTLTGSLKVNRQDNLLITDNANLTIPENILVEISDRASLNIQGSINNSGILIILNDSILLGSGSLENNGQIICWVSTQFQNFQGTLTNNGEISYIGHGSFIYPQNYSGNLANELKYYSNDTYPSTFETNFELYPSGNPNTLVTSIYSTDFGWIENDPSVNADIEFNENSKIPFLTVKTDNYFNSTENWDNTPIYVFVKEELNGKSKLNSVFVFNITDQQSQPLYMLANSKIYLDKKEFNEISVNNTSTVNALITDSQIELFANRELRPQVIRLYNQNASQFYQVNPIPLDVIFTDGSLNSSQTNLNYPSNAASYPISVISENTGNQNWSIQNIVYSGSETGSSNSINNINSALNEEGIQLATISNVINSGKQFLLSTSGQKGAGIIYTAITLNTPEKIGPVTCYVYIDLGIGAVNLTGLSFGPGEQNSVIPVRVAPDNYFSGIYYEWLESLFVNQLPELGIYAQSPINGQTDGVTNFNNIEASTNHEYNASLALDTGNFIFKSSNPSVIDYNPDTLTFEISGQTGSANIYIVSKDGQLSSLNAPSGQIGYLPVQIGNAIPAQNVTLSANYLYLTTKPEGTVSSLLTYSVEPLNSTDSPVWTANPTSVISLSRNENGTVTVNAVAEGQAIITCQVGNKTAQCKVIVSNDNVICDDVSITGNGSADYFNVYISNLQSNPALGLSSPVVRAEMFAFSVREGTDTFYDLNAKRMENVAGTNDWVINLIPVNDDKVNNWFFAADNIKVHVYGSTDLNTNGNMVRACEYSWVEDYPENSSVNYIANVNGAFMKPSISKGVAGTTGKNQPITGIRISSCVPNVEIQAAVHFRNIGWLGENNKVQMFPDGVYIGSLDRIYQPSDVPVEAYSFELIGSNAENYELQFRAHVQNLGWLDWQSTSDPNAILGTTGKALNLEAYTVRLVPVGTPLPANDEF